MAVYDHSKLTFFIPKGTLPWQPIFNVFNLTLTDKRDLFMLQVPISEDAYLPAATLLRDASLRKITRGLTWAE